MSEIVNASAAAAQAAVQIYGCWFCGLRVYAEDVTGECIYCGAPVPVVGAAPASFDFAWESHMDMLLSGTPQEVV